MQNNSRMRIGLLCTVVAVMLGACASNTGASVTPTNTRSGQDCVDRDTDGFGDNCLPGNDCDDHDPKVHVGCLRCAEPNEHCACKPDAKPAACYLEKTFGEDGGIMCHEGTRYCRQGTWSGCESIYTYPLPSKPTNALIDVNAPVSQCNDCDVTCFRITDNLDPVDSGLPDVSDNVAFAAGGGLTLGMIADAGVVDAGPGSTVDAIPPPCTFGVGEDLDCDGIPNTFDPYPHDPPFATANPSLFLQIGAGQTGTGQIDLQFFLNSADVYFLVDQTGSMAEERDQLKLDLTTGDFVNDTHYQCSDFDFDRQPNNEQKSKGIVGAIRCKIRDANFGTGFFRELPFSGYANNDHVVFGNYQDITGNVDSVLTAINKLTTIGNNDWPEASMIALHNVLTGSGMYLGTDRRGIAPRTDCPSLTWGYPCFRQDAVPIVVMFTDAQFHNGPDTNTYAYPNTFSITAGSTNAYTALDDTNDTFNSAANLGDVTSVYKTFSGDTSSMASDLPATLIGTTCLSSGAGTDALFKFDVAQQKQIVIESTGSQFDTVLGLFTGIPGSPTDLAASANTNEAGASALDMGNVTTDYVRVSGNTSAMTADYQWSNVGCDAATTSPDAVFQFSTSGSTRVALDSSGSSFDTVVGLYSAAPALPPTYTAIADTNDDYSTAYSAGDIYNQAVGFSGDTSNAAIYADYSQAQIGCGVDSTANDVAYSFTLSTPTRVRISSEGSSFDTVLGLYDSLANPVGVATVPATNDAQPAAYNVGTLDGHIFQLTGSTTNMRADYPGAQFGCGPADTAPDAMFKFHLDAPADVQIDTIGTTWDTVLGLFNNANLDPSFYFTTDNTNETYATAKMVGLGSGEIRVSGGNTNSMHADYNSTVDVSCSGSDTSPDATYRFHLDAPTRVRVDTDGSGFDTTLSIHNVQPGEPATALTTNSNDTAATAFNVGDIYHQSFQKTGNSSTLTHNYTVGCNGGTTAKDAVYKFSLSTASTVQIDTMGTNFDTVLAVYGDPMIAVDPATPTAVAVGTTNTPRTGAYSIGVLDAHWYRYSGNDSTMAATWTDTSCGAAATAPDAFFTFTLNSTRNVTITTSGSAFDTVLFLYQYTNAGLTTYALNSCDHSNSGDEILTKTLTAGTYFIVVKGDKATDKGNYVLSVRDNAIMANPIACDDDGGGSLTSKVTTALAAGTYNVVLSGRLAASNGPYTMRFRDSTWWNSFGELQCNNDISTSNHASQVEQDLIAGDYWFIVKGLSSTSKGTYAVHAVDMNNRPSGPPAIACDDNGGGGTVSKIVRAALPAGDYWVGLKGKAASNYGSYKVNIRDTTASASGAIVQCDDNSGDSPTSLIERDMQAGTYQVVLKGKTAASKGAYKLSLRDVTKKPISRLACVNDGGAGTTSYLESTLAAGTYYAILKGNNPTDKGAYSFSVRDVTNRPLASTTCDDNGSSFTTSKITRTLDPGTYYVALKGKDANASGTYQLSLGGGTTHSSTYTPPIWSSTLAAIQNTEAHVISILSCHDDTSGHASNSSGTGDCDKTRTQAEALAKASNTLGLNLNPLVFDIDNDGGGLSDSVVGAVSALANYLEMALTVRVLFDPDPNPGFAVTVRAIDEPGDGCNGLVGITHQHCIPGASPRFQIDFKNPASPNSVPLNTHDPKGGYNFRVELIADNQFIVEQIPVYIIPIAAPTVGPPAPQYYPTGSYHQDASAPGCKGNQQPDWRDLSWVADVYDNTSVTFSACTAWNETDLATCTPHVLATVRGIGTCSSDADCAIGYCAASIGVCQVATSGACTSNSQCGANAFCEMTDRICTFNSQPVYIGSSLGDDNFKSFIRMDIGLSATEPYLHPPVLHRWELTYLCNQLL
jgi:hypothetical protein